MKFNWKSIGLSAAALFFCIVPPAIATIQSFPVWIEKSSSATISGIAVFLLAISAVPIFKMAKKYLKSPAIPIVWAFLAVVFMLIRQIVDQMCIIMTVGAISNTIGWLLFKARDKFFNENGGNEK